eukprot:Nitzschia sp. Nitz4//scaffold85_size83877//19445//21288//NITZ4_005221-RA/size83877-processed-gene-0.136-mRNA-1//-1//CDS//3329559113//7783//frame0
MAENTETGASASQGSKSMPFDESNSYTSNASVVSGDGELDIRNMFAERSLPPSTVESAGRDEPRSLKNQLEIETMQRPPGYWRRGSESSLKDKTLLVPMELEFDDLSSIHTFGYMQEMKASGTVSNTLGDVEHGKSEGAIPETVDKAATTKAPKKEQRKGGCPMWLVEAPRWLKFLLGFAISLLVGAIALVGVGTTLALDKSSSSGQVNAPFAFPTQSPTVSTLAPVTVTEAPTSVSVPHDNTVATANPTSSPTSPPTAAKADPSTEAPKSPTSSPTAHDAGSTPVSTSTPTVSPTSSPTSRPTGTPTSSPTSTPTETPTPSTVSFFFTGGRFIGDSLTTLQENLPSLPEVDGGNTALIHLGDWNSPYATECSEESYQTAVDLYSTSSVPVYFVPGDNEYNDCPNPEEAFSFWGKYMVDFESTYWPEPQAWSVTRQEPNYAENFAFVHKRVLAVGINLVGGAVHDSNEWEQRQNANLDWINNQYYANVNDIGMMVVFGHSDPGVAANANFFTPFFERVRDDYGVPVVYVHRNVNGDVADLATAYDGIDNLMVVVVEGSIWPPLRLDMDATSGEVEIDQSGWFDEYSTRKMA